MRYRELLEVYSEPNTYLHRYLKDNKFDPGASWWAVCNIIGKNSQYYKALTKALGRKVSKTELDDEDPEIFYQLPEDMQESIAEQVVNYLLQHDPAEAPSSAYLSLTNKKSVIHRLTWLIHFTDDPEDIATEGFKYGMYDPSKLGLTTYIKNTSSDKSDGGYNFAFEAGSKYSKWAEHQKKYGKHAVMFQNSGVRAWHNGDEEEQIIFWGPDVQPRNIVVLKHYDDWTVIGKTLYYKSKYPSFDKELFKGDFEKVEDWVMKHFQQYRKALTGF